MATHSLNLLARLMTVMKGSTAAGYPTSHEIDANTQALAVKTYGVGNVNAKVRDALESFSTDRWNIVQQGAGDIVGLDGNAASASYMIISKNPLEENTETILESVNTFKMPYRVGAAVTLNQRIHGQEHVLEQVSVLTDSALAMPVLAPIPIAIIQQTTTTLTITFANAAHGLLPGDRISVYGVTSEGRLNYPMLTVGTISNNGLSINCTAQAGGALPSLTAGPFSSQGTVVKSDPLGYSRNGFGVLYDGTTATNLSHFIRSEGGSALPSGTVGGSHQVTLGNTGASQLVSSGYNVSFAPAQMLDFISKIEGVSVTSVAVDNAASTPTIIKRTQVVPNPDRDYKLRLRSKNLRSFSRPVGKIVSATKSGTTTSTIVMDAAHGLSVGDWVVLYGVRDITNFPNVTTAVQVQSVPNATTITVIQGSAATATSYGGTVVEVWGQLVGGMVNHSVQTVARTNNVLTLVMNTTVAGLVIGEYINLHGVRNSAGADVGVDGPYRVRDFSTTNLILEPISMKIGDTTTNYSPSGADISTTNVGGAIIKRTDYRLHFVRAMDNDKLVVEVSGGGRPDRLESVPVLLTDTNVSMLIGGSSAANSVGPGASNRHLGVLSGIGSANADRSSSTAVTTSTNTGAVAEDMGQAVSAQVIIASIGGTNPTLDMILEESYDGTTFYPVYHLPRITANGSYPLPPVLMGGRRRWSWTIGGTSPTMTININTTRLSTAPINKQFFDRTLNLNSAGAVGASFPIAGVLQLNSRISVSSIGTGANPQVALDVSDDGINWVQLGLVTISAVGTLNVYTGQQSASFARFRTVVAGTAAALTHGCISGVN